MKKNILLTIAVALGTQLVCLAAPAVADSLATKAKQDEHLAVYRTALVYNDMGTAATALVSYLNLGGNTQFRDTLAMVYYNQNNLAGAYKMANEQFAKNDKNVTALTLLADISGQTNDAKTSLDWYEKLCVLNKMPYNHYQLATKQFALERKLECKQSLMKIMEDTATAKQQKVTMQIGQGYSESAPVLAAAYNMLGVLAFQENKLPEAKQLYLNALKYYPDFVIAKQNLEALNKPPLGVKKKK
jgi:tetratricopeptide (TPR) repeat protein